MKYSLLPIVNVPPVWRTVTRPLVPSPMMPRVLVVPPPLIVTSPVPLNRMWVRADWIVAFALTLIQFDEPVPASASVPPVSV